MSINAYLEKSYYKTASLVANSSKAAGLLSGVSAELAEDLYSYGRNLGLAFQIVDDILDFTGSTESLGKPAGSDLQSGNLNAPTLYALEEKPYLETLIEREFAQEGDLEQALALIQESSAIKRSRELAAHHAKLAVEHISKFPDCDSRKALIELADWNLNRLY
jgi:all-trans-nonaprenyl-diphosphate synthase